MYNLQFTNLAVWTGQLTVVAEEIFTLCLGAIIHAERINTTKYDGSH